MMRLESQRKLGEVATGVSLLTEAWLACGQLALSKLLIVSWGWDSWPTNAGCFYGDFFRAKTKESRGRRGESLLSDADSAASPETQSHLRVSRKARSWIPHTLHLKPWSSKCALMYREGAYFQYFQQKITLSLGSIFILATLGCFY